MVSFPWLPIGHTLANGAAIGRVLCEGTMYQVVERRGGGSILLVDADCEAADHLIAALAERAIPVNYPGRDLLAASASPDATPTCVGDIPLRQQALSASEALQLASALSRLAKQSPKALWSKSLFLPGEDLCLPFDEGTNEDRKRLAIALLSGGAEDVSLTPVRISILNPWLTVEEVVDALLRMGFPTGLTDSEPGYNRRQVWPAKKMGSTTQGEGNRSKRSSGAGADQNPMVEFDLPGQPALERFMREYVVEHFMDKKRYEAMGVLPPGGVLLWGPPGSGKTFAVQELAKYLGWPLFEVSMGVVGSQFIHRTSHNLRKLFNDAAERAPSLVVIDEVDAIIGERSGYSHDHKIEEISEMLRLVEGESARGIVVFGTTNRRNAIDPAFLRKGRFDHVLEVSYPVEEDVRSALERLLADRPTVAGLGVTGAATKLAGRPMSDVAWVVNEAARLAVRASKDAIDDISLYGAIARSNTSSR